MRSLKKNTVKSSWILSFLLMLALPIIIMSAAFSWVNNTISRNVDAYNYEKLSKARDSIDLMLSTLESYSHSIEADKEIMALTGHGASNAEAIAALEAVKRTCAFNENLKDVWIVCPENDFAVSSEGATAVKYFSYKTFDDENIRREWNERYRQEFRGEFFIADAGEMYGERILLPIYAKTVGSPGAKANLFIIMDINKLMALQSDDEALFVLGADNMAVSSKPNVALSDVVKYENLGTSGRLRLEKKDLVGLYMTSGVTPWKYVMISSKKVFMNGVDTAVRVSICSLVISCLLGCLLAVFLANRNYTPIRQMVGKVSRIVPEVGAQKDEYAYINNVINSVINENRQLNRMANRDSSLLRERFLENLLFYRIYDADTGNKMERFGIDMTGDSFCVVRIMIVEYDNDLFSDDMATLMYAIKNISEEVINNSHVGYVTESNGSAFVIVCMENGENGSSLAGYAAQIVEILKNTIGVEVDVAVSRVHKTVAGIHDAYKDTLDAQDYKLCADSGEVILIDELAQSDSGEFYSYPIDTEFRIINSIIQGKYEEVCGLVDEVFAENRNLRLLIYDIAGTIIRAADEAERITGKEFGRDKLSVPGLFRNIPIAEAKRNILADFASLCEFVSENSSSDKNISSAVCEIVDKNFRDGNLNVSQIAYQMDMNSAYVSRVFKYEMGISLLDYINHVRIEEAKKQLKNSPNINMENLAQMCGFSNVRTFRRVFTKCTGAAPTKWVGPN